MHFSHVLFKIFRECRHCRACDFRHTKRFIYIFLLCFFQTIIKLRLYPVHSYCAHSLWGARIISAYLILKFAHTHTARMHITIYILCTCLSAYRESHKIPIAFTKRTLHDWPRMLSDLGTLLYVARGRHSRKPFEMRSAAPLARPSGPPALEIYLCYSSSLAHRDSARAVCVQIYMHHKKIKKNKIPLKKIAQA